MIYEWQDCFPHPTFRDRQAEVIDRIISNLDHKKFAILEAPTGAGKSAIGYTIGRHFESYYYITAQKILQSQLSNDFGEDGRWSGEYPMVELKGRNAYECIFYQKAVKDPNYEKSPAKMEKIKEKSKEYVDCSVGECKKQRKSKLKYCEKECLYYRQFYSALKSKSVLMNFHSFLFQTEFIPHWPHKNILIIDEAHNAEQVLMDYVSFSFNDLSYDFKLPKMNTAEEYFMFFEDIEIESIIADKIRESVKDGDTKKEEYWIQQLVKYRKFKSSIKEHEWIPKWEEKEISKGGRKFRIVELKPLFIRDYSHELLFSKADKVLFMSATILDVNIMCESLGIDKSQVYATRLGSDFPVENRPIYFKSCGSMSYRSKNATLPRMMQSIEEICSEYTDKRGIIHTHNFEIANYIRQNASNTLKIRLYFQNDYGTKDDMLEQHARSENGIIIAPAMHEGLDLKDDLARFQIICKMPYPGIGDNPQLKRRMEIDDKYYQYLTSLKLVQSYGRAIRSNTDYADTYVLDENFKSFYNRSPELLPEWFREAIIW